MVGSQKLWTVGHVVKARIALVFALVFASTHQIDSQLHCTIMTEVATEVKPCSNPGCDQPGTSSSSACKTTTYCGVNCQTADWAHHKEECDGHLRKLGMATLAKAKGFDFHQNWMQSLRYADIAITKLKKLKDRRLETVQALSDAMGCRFDALNFMARHKEALACIQECYTLWVMNHMRNPGSVKAALGLIQSCINNGEYEDAKRYADHAIFMINDKTDNLIPVDQRPQYLAKGSRLRAQAIYEMAQVGGIPPEEKKKAGELAIASARKALELDIQLFGSEDSYVANDMDILATALDFFNNEDDDEVLRLQEQSNAITSRVEGRMSSNVAAGVGNLGNAYKNRAQRAATVNDWLRCLTNLELAVPHFREAVRIYRANNHMDSAARNLRTLTEVEEQIRHIGVARAAFAATRG